MPQPLIQLVTDIAGEINGSAFACHGTGAVGPDGTTHATLAFDRALRDFTPMLCKSWQCKHHIVLGLPDDNPLVEYVTAGGHIMDRTIIEYPYPNSVIVMTSVLRRPTPSLQHVYQTRVGTYTGPTDIVEQLPYTMHISPAGPGRAAADSVRQVRRSTGEIIDLNYIEDLYFTDGFTLPEPLGIEIAGTAAYNPALLTYQLDTTARAALMAVAG